MGLIDGEITENENFAVNYLNYLRRWDLFGVHDINDFTAKFAKRLDSTILNAMGELNYNNDASVFQNTYDMLKNEDLFAPAKFHEDKSIVSKLTGLREHLKDEFNVNFSDDEIRTVLFAQNLQDLNVISTQTSNLNILEKFLYGGINMLTNAGYHISQTKDLEIVPQVIDDLVLPLALFAGGATIANSVGGKFILTHLLGEVAGQATAMKAYSEFDKLYKKMAYTDAIEGLGWEFEGDTAIDWDMVLLGSGLSIGTQYRKPIIQNVKNIGSLTQDKVSRVFSKINNGKNTVFTSLNNIFESLFKSG